MMAEAHMTYGLLTCSSIICCRMTKSPSPWNVVVWGGVAWVHVIRAYGRMCRCANVSVGVRACRWAGEQVTGERASGRAGVQAGVQACQRHRKSVAQESRCHNR